MEEELQKLKKELKLTRICNLLVAVLLVCVIAGGAYMVDRLAPAVTALQELQPVAEKLGDLDVEMLNEKISQLDIDGLNQAIEGLDTQELTKAIKNINDVSDKLQEIGENLSEFTNSFGNTFSGLFGGGR